MSFNDLKIFQKPVIEAPFSFHSSADVAEKMAGYSKADREMFILVFLNAQNVVTSIETHSVGGINSNGVYPQQVLRSALLHNALSMICVHNHPSGDPLPSVSDRDITKQIGIGAQFVGIKLLDHIIIGDGRYFSFADEGLIDDYVAEIEQNFGGVKVEDRTSYYCSGDPYWLRAKFSGSCSRCKKEIKGGDRIFYFPKTKDVFCDGDLCGTAESSSFEAAAQDEFFYNN
jgi:DNA repair protein RadC